MITFNNNDNPTHNIINLLFLKDFYNSSIDEVLLPDCISPDVLYCFRMFGFTNIKFTFLRTEESCPHCGGKLHSNGYQSRKPNGISGVRIKRYICSKCGKLSRASFNNYIDPNCNYTNTIKHWGIKSDEIGYESYRKLSERFEAIFNTKLAKSTIFQHVKEVYMAYQEKEERMVEEEVEKRGLKDSGKYHNDEQFPHCNGESMVRMMIVDAIHKYPYHDLIEDADKFDNELIEKYFHDTLDKIPHEVMITDGYKAYPDIIEKFGMKHQRCVFHIMQNAVKDIFPEIRKLKKENKNKENKIDKKKRELEKYKKEYKPRRGRISDKKQQELHDNIKNIEKEIKILKNEIKENKNKIKELEKDFERISNIFKTEENPKKKRKLPKKSIAKGRLSRLSNNINFLQKPVAKAVRRVKNNFKPLTLYLREEKKENEIPKTNNTVELFFGVTLPAPLKRKYRTQEGLERKLRNGRTRWIHRVVLGNEKPINNFFNCQNIK